MNLTLTLDVTIPTGSSDMFGPGGVANTYVQPDGVFTYRAPDGTALYLQP